MTRSIVLYRFVALVVLFGLFYALDWMQLRVALRDAIKWSFEQAGYSLEALVHEGSPAIKVDGKIHFYTAECTYLDLVMMVTPFVWVFGATHWSNLLRIAIMVLVILVGNLVRCWTAVYLDVRGVSRFYAHDLPDCLVWWPTVVIVALLALRRDLGDHSEPTSKPRVSEARMPICVHETLAPAADD